MEQIDLPSLAGPISISGAGTRLYEPPPPEAPGSSSAAPESQQPGEDLIVPAAPDSPSGDDHIQIPATLALPSATPKFTKGSAAHTAYARAGKALKKASRRADEAEQHLAIVSASLGAVVNLIPGASKLLGQSEHTAVNLRRKAVEVASFLLLTRALHLPASTQINLGVKLRRLICFAAKLVDMRQKAALAKMLESSERCLRVCRERLVSGHVHMSYVHIWDEVETKFKAKMSASYRDMKQLVTVHTLVQRGVVGFALSDGTRRCTAQWNEQWLCKPVQVKSTAAAGLYPGVAKAMPAETSFDDLEALKKLANQVGSFTLMPCCDRASSNLSILKRLGSEWEERILPATGGQILFWPECCGIHLYHRAKMQLKGLRHHTMRHFGIANLYRMASVQSRMVTWIEQNVPNMVRRIIGPPPEDLKRGLLEFVDVLFDLDAPHHRRKNGQASQRIADLMALCRMVNCDLAGGEWVHHCWDSDTQQPCCRNQDECNSRIVAAVVNGLLGASDPIPAESRWTHLLMNMKRTLLRYAVFEVGTKSFQVPKAGVPTGPLEVDEEALDAFFKAANASRVDKTTEYYVNPRNVQELAVYVVLLEECDSRLLYPLMGDPVREPSVESKLHSLLNRDTSLIGSSLQALARLAQLWATDDPRRRPWCILAVLKIDAWDKEFARWARGQLLRLASAIFRRFEVQYSGYPFCLFALISDAHSEAEKTDAAGRLLEAGRNTLDAYSHGLRTLFPAVDRLLSDACRATVNKDFSSQAYGTDCVERMNAEIVASRPRRSPGKNFSNSAREALLKQLAVAHKQHGGLHPLGSGVLAQSAPKETVQVMPLLPQEASCLPALQDGAASGAASSSASSHEVSSVAAASSGSASSALAIPGMAIIFPSSPTVTRTNPALLISPAEPQTTAMTVKASAQVGLSPYMLEKNKFMRAARIAMGGKLTEGERQEASASFRKMWKEPTEGDSAFKEAYDAWRHTPKEGKKTEVVTYKQMWAGGCNATPFTKEELHERFLQVGWPTDVEALRGFAGCRPGARGSKCRKGLHVRFLDSWNRPQWPLSIIGRCLDFPPLCHARGSTCVLSKLALHTHIAS